MTTITPALQAQINANVEALRDGLLHLCDNAEAPSAPDLDPAHSMEATSLAALAEVIATVIARKPAGEAMLLFRGFVMLAQQMLLIRLSQAARAGGSPHAD